MSKNITLIIQSCGSCPFCNKDNEYGFDGCNLDETLNLNKVVLNSVVFEELTDNSIHKNCPLKENNYKIKI